MKKDLVSIIIPTYSRPNNLCRAIDSVLSQDYDNIEIIVVDDNGVNTPFQIETETILKRYIDNESIVYLKHEQNKNGSAARNTGFRASHGQFINYLDDDDVFMPNKISEQIFRLRSVDSDFGACYCNTKILGINRKRTTKNIQEGNLLIDLLSGKVEFNTSAILFRREVIDSLNGFDERFLRCQDWELMTRFFRNYKICVVKACLMEKYATSNIVTNKPYITVQYRNFLLNEFDDDITKSGGKNEIYSYIWGTTSIALLTNGYKKDGFRYFCKACKYRLPSFFMFSKFMYFLFK